MDDSHEAQYTYLQPYIHQVGGHSSMLCLDEATVCKPVVERELQFYECLPDDLRPYAPEYYGVIKVNVLPDGEYISLVGTAPTNYTPKMSAKFKSRLRFRRSGSLEQDIGSEEKIFEEDAVTIGQGKPTGMNPWVFKCHRDHLAALAASIEAKNKPQNFLVLENLTWRFRLPCILDLKMGTRQYDDNDSLAKRQSKMVKVVSTTSAKLGVRLGGMQVYQVTTGRFLCRNKFYGRSLSSTGFSTAVRHFLHDGRRLRTEILPPLIRRLESLADTLERQNSLRLYTTSLLLLYEGAPLNGVPLDRGIDKCDILDKSDSSENQEEEDDEDAGTRLERSSSTGSFNSIGRKTSDEKLNARGKPSEKLRRRSSSSSTPARDPTRKNEAHQQDHEPLTDIRIIDFAHSTHCGMSDSVMYSGSDHGFLFGLENMIDILKNIYRDYR